MKICMASLFLPLSAAFAQQFNFSNIGADKGLPSSEVYSVLQDRRGYIWFTTNNGVCRYNGKEFTTFTTSEGLTDNTVFRMCEDHKGRIWFGAQNNEICYWENDSIHQVPCAASFRNSGFSGGAVILKMYADLQDNIWISTTHGLFLAESGKRYVALRKIENTGECNLEVRLIDGIQPIASGMVNYAEGQQDLVVRYSTVTGWKRAAFVNALRVPSGHIFGLIRTRKGAILFSKANNIYCIDPAGGVSVKSFDKVVTWIFGDSRGRLWIGFIKGGVACFENGNLDSTPVCSLDGYSIAGVHEDRAGGIWATSLERGIFYAPSTAVRIYPGIPSLDDHIVVLEKWRDRVIIGTFGNHIYEGDSSGIIPSPALQKWSEKFGRLIALKSFGDTIYAGFDNGLLILNNSFARVKNSYGLSFYRVRGKEILKAQDHSTWRFHGGGIYKLAADSACVTEQYPTSLRLTCAMAAEDGGLFLGTKNGLYRFRGGTFSPVTDDSLLRRPIVQMKKDLEGTVWMATGGAGVLAWKDHRVMQVSGRNGLLSDICSAIEIDTSGNVWVGTAKGLSSIRKDAEDIRRRSIKNITTKTGLNSDEITRLLADQNRLWVGTMSGISLIDIREAQKPAALSPVYLRAVRVNKLPSDTGLSDFTYDQNDFTFLLDGLDFSDHSGKQYRYRLQGYDTAWQETSTGEVQFVNLPPGNYAFYAAAANPDGKWSAAPACYNFTIAEPFWLRWWFIGLECGALAAAIYLFIRFRTQAITRREEEKTRVNTMLAESEMNALRAQMNPHFIFNAINSIQRFILQKDSIQAYDYLVKFSKLIRFVLNNTRAHEIPLQQEIDTLALYVELEQLRFENAFQYQLNVGPGVDTSLTVIPPMLIQPYVENAIWHGLMPLKHRQGKLELNLSVENKMLKITIADNGIGRKASEGASQGRGHKSVGMDLSHKRVELFAKGAPASIRVQDLYNEQYEPLGTRVEITLPLVETY